jgi:hypothetical protein
LFRNSLFTPLRRINFFLSVSLLDVFLCFSFVPGGIKGRRKLSDRPDNNIFRKEGVNFL